MPNPYDPYNTSWLARLPQYPIPAGTGWYAPTSPGRRYSRSTAQPGVSQGLWKGVRESIGTVQQGLHYALAPVTYANEQLDRLFRYSAREGFGLTNLPEDVTRGQAVKNLLLPPSQAWGTETAPGLYSMPTAWGKQAALGLAEAAGVDQDALEKVRAQPSIDDYWNRAGRQVEKFALETAPEAVPFVPKGVPRAIAGAVTEFGASLAQDPLIYALPTAMRGAQGSYLANKLLASQKGIGLYAPKVAAALESAAKAPGGGRTAQALATALRVKPQADIAAAAATAGRSAVAADRLARGATLAERMNKARRIGEGYVHYGFMTDMGLGAVGGAMDTIGEWAKQGRVTPHIAEMATHSLLSGAMAGHSAFGHRKRQNLQAQAALARKQILPGQRTRGGEPQPLPLDVIPDRLAPSAESWASEWANMLGAGKRDAVYRSAATELPTELMPHARRIMQQAEMEANAWKVGGDYLKRMRDEFGDGKQGVEVVPGKEDGLQHVLQRNSDGKVIGAATVRNGELVSIAGPKALLAPEARAEAPSVRPVYEKLQEMGVKRSEESLSILGQMARRRFVEKQVPRAALEGRQSIENIQRAQQELFEAGLGDLMALPAYSVERAQPYFSQAIRVVEAPKTQGKMPGEQWLRFLKDQKRGVKADELKWTGLDEYLEARRGQRVTKQEILEYLRDNRVQVTEVVRGGRAEREDMVGLDYEDSLAILNRLDRENYLRLDRASDEGRPLSDADQNMLQDYQRMLTNPTQGELRTAIDRLSLEGQRTAEQRFFDQAERLEAAYERIEGGEGPAVRHGEWTLPGGKGYREVNLIVQPRVPKPSPEVLAAREKVFERYRPEIEEISKHIRERDETQHHVPGTYGWNVHTETVGYRPWFPTEARAKDFARRQGGNVRPADQYDAGYARTSLEGEMERAADREGPIPEAVELPVSHAYPEPGSVGWVRFNERVGPNGERVLFIEEIQQSDWAAGGRAEGFAPTEAEIVKLQGKVRAADNAYAEFIERAEKKYKREPKVEVTKGYDQWNIYLSEKFGDLESGLVLWSKDTKAEAQKWAKEWAKNQVSGRWDVDDIKRMLSRVELKELDNLLAAKDTATYEIERARDRRGEYPRAPFVEESKDFVELAVKRMLKWASDEGFDRVAWTTGEHQIKRWEGALRSRVDRLEWEKTPEGVQLKGYKGGAKVVDTRHAETELSDAIGKAMAKRILESPERSGAIMDEWIVRDAEGKEVGRFEDQWEANSQQARLAEQTPEAKRLIAERDRIAKAANEGGATIDPYTRPGKRMTDIANRLMEIVDEFKVERSTESGLVIDKAWPRQLYDQMIPGAMQRLARKFNRKAEVVVTEMDLSGEVGRATMQEDVPAEFRTGKWSAWGRDEVPREFKTEAEARAFAEANEGDYAAQAKLRSQGIDISPEMKSTVREEGFPLFDVQRQPPETTARPMPEPEAMKDLRNTLVELYPEGTKIKEADGVFDIRVPDGRLVRWRPNQEAIEIDIEAFQKARGRKPTPEEVAKGVTYRMSKGAIVDLVKGADPRTTIHEQWHVLKHMGFLTDKQQNALRRRFKGEEAEADAFADWWLKEKKPSNSVFEQVARGIKRVYRMITGATEAVFEQVLRDSLLLQKKPGAPRLGRKIPRVSPSIFVDRGDSLRNLNWHLNATGQMPGRKGAKYRREPVEGNALRLERDGKPFFVGPINFDQWMQKATAWVGQPGSVEWTRARNWYKDLLTEFNRIYGEKDGERMLTLWALTQQLEGPSGGMGNLLRAEDVVSGFRAEDAARAGLAHERLITALRGGQPELTSPKLPDFLDSVHEVATRQYVNNDVRGGQPAPVDVHAGRDVGFVDTTVVNKVRKFFGDEIADALTADMAKFSKKEGKLKNAPPDDGQYLYGHEFYNRLAEYLNAKGIDGGGFKASEVQAIGWVAQQRMFGDVAEGPSSIFGPNLSHIAVEIAPGTGSRLESLWAEIPEGKHPAITARVLDEIVPEAARLAGVRVLDKADQVGVWQQFSNPNGVLEVLATPEGALRLAKVLGNVLQQSEVWAQRQVGVSRRNATGVDIRSTSGYNFGSRADVLRFWQEALAKEPALGASVVRSSKGEPLLRVIAEDGTYGAFGSKQQAVAEADALTKRLPEDLRKKEAYRVEQAGDQWLVQETRVGRIHRIRRAVEEWAGDRDVRISLPNLELLKSVNDWSVNHAGEGHRVGLRGVEGEALDGLSRHTEESLRRNIRRSLEAEERVYREPEPGGPRRGVDDPPQPRGPPADPELGTPVGEQKYATDTAPSPPPDPSMGRPKPPGRRPRVEERVDNLGDALAQQRELGIPQKELVLSREHRRNWEALDPEVKKLIQNWSDDAILSITDRRNLTDTEVMALDAVVRGRREAKELARLEYEAEKGGPKEDAAWTAYVESLAKYLPLERANIQDGTGTARALAARARLMDAARTKDQQFLRQVLKEKDTFPGLTDKDVNKLVQMFEQGDPRLGDALRSVMAGRWKQWQTLLRAFLITPSSEIPNLLGNTIVQGIEVTDTAFSAGLDWAVSKLRGTQRERYLGEVGAEVGGMIEAAPAAMSEFLKQRLAGIYHRAWTGESRPIELGRRLEYQVSPFKSKAGRLIATSLDALAEGDRLFRAPIAQGELLKRSYRQAVKDTGKKMGPEVESRALEVAMDVMKRPERHVDMIRQIQSSTARRLFQGKPWGAVDLLRELERRYPWVTAVLPFVRTPANIARYAIQHSPMGFLTPDAIRATQVLAKGKPVEIKDATGKTIRKMTQGEATDIIAQRLTGTMFFAMALGAAKMGKLTGSGPVDWDERKALMETGWRPYSIVADIDGQKVYIPFARFDPVSQVAGIAADVAEFDNVRDGQDLASKAIGSVAENFTNRTYLKGMIDFTEALNDPVRFAGNYAIGIGTMHIPRQLGRIAVAIDPVIRDVRPLDRSIAGYPEKLAKSVMRNIPGLSTMLPPRVGPTGEPIVRPGEGVSGALMRAVSPIQVSPERPGRELEGLMAQIGYVPGEPRTFVTIQGHQIQLEREDLEIIQRADRNAAFELRRLLTNPMFQQMPDTVEEGGKTSKEYIIKKTYDKYRTIARRMMYMSPSFRARARQQLQEARTS